MVWEEHTAQLAISAESLQPSQQPGRASKRRPVKQYLSPYTPNAGYPEECCVEGVKVESTHVFMGRPQIKVLSHQTEHGDTGFYLGALSSS